MQINIVDFKNDLKKLFYFAMANYPFIRLIPLINNGSGGGKKLYR